MALQWRYWPLLLLSISCCQCIWEMLFLWSSRLPPVAFLKATINIIVTFYSYVKQKIIFIKRNLFEIPSLNRRWKIKKRNLISTSYCGLKVHAVESSIHWILGDLLNFYFSYTNRSPIPTFNVSHNLINVALSTWDHFSLYRRPIVLVEIQFLYSSLIISRICFFNTTNILQPCSYLLYYLKFGLTILGWIFWRFRRFNSLKQLYFYLLHSKQKYNHFH